MVIATTANEEPATRARLAELGVDSIETIDPTDRRRLLLAMVQDEWEAERLTATLRNEGQLVVTRPTAGRRLDAWIEHTAPIRFRDRLSVSFAWSEHERRGLPGLIELGAGGWGNGEHPTTRMLIDALIERISGGERVLDIGCGSGVLGLCAIELGASYMLGLDVLPAAVESTRRNAILNGMGDRVEASGGPLAEIDRPFEVIVANVGRAAIVELAPQLVRLLAPNGWLAVSGISPPLAALVAGFLRPLVEIERQTSGEWASVVFAHPARDQTS